ncbi:MAG: hypothetical protein AAFP81_17280, partial [Pseudomonadota bacterium]
CDHDGCGADIDRGLAYVCGGEPYGGDHGCGLYFCGKHLFLVAILDEGEEETDDTEVKWLCARCRDKLEPFEPTPDTKAWIRHKLTHPSWGRWRASNPQWVEKHMPIAFKAARRRVNG